ncbi:hypothetical protein [Acinetobacter puyangensis]|uniref:hypothetical protein n=1 Tax=Acinetobacter puyangensis TaxID=1096779 RepID=UPI003A4DB068
MNEVIALKRSMPNKEAIYAQYPIVEIKRLYDYRLKYQVLSEEIGTLVKENQQLREKILQLKSMLPDLKDE